MITTYLFAAILIATHPASLQILITSSSFHTLSIAVVMSFWPRGIIIKRLTLFPMKFCLICLFFYKELVIFSNWLNNDLKYRIKIKWGFKFCFKFFYVTNEKQRSRVTSTVNYSTADQIIGSKNRDKAFQGRRKAVWS